MTSKNFEYSCRDDRGRCIIPSLELNVRSINPFDTEKNLFIFVGAAAFKGQDINTKITKNIDRFTFILLIIYGLF